MALTILHPFAVTIPAGTLSTAPLVTLTKTGDNIVDRIEWVFPAGCNGLVGIQIGNRAVPVIPTRTTEWIIRSGDSSSVYPDALPDSGDWSVIGYNTGAFAHTIQALFYVHRKQADAPKDLLIVPGLTLTGTGES